MHGSLSYDGSKFELLGFANWTPLSFGALFTVFGFLGILETEFIVLFIVMPATFVILWLWSFQTQKQRLDDLVDEITANLKTKISAID